MQKPMYTRINHFFSMLKKFNEQIPDEKYNNIQVIKLVDFECSVCLDNCTDVGKLKCNHMFCMECIKKIAAADKIKCPLCRRDFIIKTVGDNCLTDAEIKIICNSFKDVYAAFEKVKGDRINFLPHSYIVKKLCDIHGIKTNLNLKTKKEYLYDDLWKKITEQLNYQ